jgi:FlaA1/EpsC-like NDP-sugar epimerase
MDDARLFEIFEGRSVLVTGGTGTFGRSLVSTLLRKSAASA